MKTKSSPSPNTLWQLAVFCAIQAVIFGALFHTIYNIEYSGTGLYFEYSGMILDGRLPYRDFTIEYPPVSLVFFLIPRLFADNWVSFAVFYQVEVVIFAIIGLFIVYDLARRLGKAPWQLMGVYTLGVLAMGPITGQQFDIFPATMVLAAVYLFSLGKYQTAWVLLALGALTKIYPLAIAPLFLVFHLSRRQYRQSVYGVVSFAVVGLVVMLPFLVMAPSSLLSLYHYHADRGLQLETTYSSALMVADMLGLVNVHSSFGSGAWNIEGSIEGPLAKVSTPLMIILLAITYWYAYRRFRRDDMRTTGEHWETNLVQLGLFTMLDVIIVLVTSKILSPQYIIWLIPLLPLAQGKTAPFIWGVFVAVGILTYMIFPFLYRDLVDIKPTPTTVLALRNLFLIFMGVLTAMTIHEYVLQLKHKAAV